MAASLPTRPALLALAPMVRAGTTPLRLLAMQHGADLVYTEEIIDRRMMACVRTDNRLLQTTDFHDPSGRLCLRIADTEREKVIFQLGSADPQQALSAALKVQHDVAGIDLNAGCPKHFSTHGGMGARLLSTPDKLVAILDTLCEHIQHIPISVKIRILPSMEDTFALLRQILTTNIKRLAIHFRSPTMTPQQRALWEQVPPVLQFLASQPKRPLILLNGDLFTAESAAALRASHAIPENLEIGYMLARGAQVNASVFGTLLPAEYPKARLYRLTSKEIIRELLRLAARYDIPYQNAKWVTLGMWDQTQVRRSQQMLSQQQREADNNDGTKENELGNGIKRKREEEGTVTPVEADSGSAPSIQLQPPQEVSKKERIQCREAMSRASNMQQLFAALDIEHEFQEIQADLEARETALAQSSSSAVTKSPTLAPAIYDDMCPYVPDLRHMDEKERDPTIPLLKQQQQVAPSEKKLENLKEELTA